MFVGKLSDFILIITKYLRETTGALEHSLKLLTGVFVSLKYKFSQQLCSFGVTLEIWRLCV